MTLLKLSLINLTFYTLDMGAAIAGFYFGFGLTVANWPALLLPPSITQARSTTDLVGANDVHRNDRVYVTTDINAALLYAAAFNRGVIYEVEPVGELEPDPDCSMEGLSFQCERARIKHIQKISDSVLTSAREVLGMVPA